LLLLVLFSPLIAVVVKELVPAVSTDRRVPNDDDEKANEEVPLLLSMVLLLVAGWSFLLLLLSSDCGCEETGAPPKTKPVVALPLNFLDTAVVVVVPSPIDGELNDCGSLFLLLDVQDMQLAMFLLSLLLSS
jgi:hypothetical protein